MIKVIWWNQGAKRDKTPYGFKIILDGVSRLYENITSELKFFHGWYNDLGLCLNNHGALQMSANVNDRFSSGQTLWLSHVENGRQADMGQIYILWSDVQCLRCMELKVCWRFSNRGCLEQYTYAAVNLTWKHCAEMQGLNRHVYATVIS